MPTSTTDILFFAEDPGAANYIFHLPGSCKERGFYSKVICTGKAENIFKKHSVDYMTASSFPCTSEIFHKIKPKVLVTGTSENPESLGHFLVKKAKELKIPSIAAVDAFMNAGHRFRGETIDPFAYAPDWIFVPDEWTKKEFVDLGFPNNRAVVCGHPHYDFVHQKASEFSFAGKDKLRDRFFPSIDEKGIVAIFALEQQGGLNKKQFEKSEEYSLPGRGGNTRNEIVLEEFLSIIEDLNEKPYLVLRLPPKSEPSEFKSFIDKFDMISQKETAIEIVFAADCVFGMTSMILLEAAIMGCPTFSIVPRLIEKNWLPTIRYGLTVCASTREELRSTLPKFIRNISSKRISDSKELFYFGATQRVASFIEDIIKGNKITAS